MNINLTLLVQAINFVIAYFILTKLVLKPAMLIFEKEEAKEQKLKNSITKARLKVEEKEEFKRERWQICQRYFKQHQPESEFQTPDIKLEKASLENFKEPSKEDLENMAQDISNKIKSKIIES